MEFYTILIRMELYLKFVVLQPHQIYPPHRLHLLKETHIGKEEIQLIRTDQMTKKKNVADSKSILCSKRITKKGNSCQILCAQPSTLVSTFCQKIFGNNLQSLQMLIFWWWLPSNWSRVLLQKVDSVLLWHH